MSETPPTPAALLAKALEVLIPMIPTEVIDCRGGKCRLPICEGCFGEASAKAAADNQRVATELARSTINICRQGNL